MTVSWIKNNLSKLNPNNLARTAARTERSAQRLYQALNERTAKPQQVNATVRTARNLIDATNSAGNPSELYNFLDNKGVALLNRRSRVAFNQASNSVRTATNREQLLQASSAEISRATNIADRKAELQTLHSQAQGFVQNPTNNTRYQNYLQTLRSNLPQAQQDKANALASKAIPDAQQNLTKAQLELQVNNTPENQAALETAQKQLQAHQRELAQLDALGRKDLDFNDPTIRAEIDFANQFRVNQRRADQNWLNNRYNALDNREQAQSASSLDDALIARQNRFLHTDRTDAAVNELTSYTNQLNTAAGTNPDARILAGDLEIDPSRLAQWNTPRLGYNRTFRNFNNQNTLQALTPRQVASHEWLQDLNVRNVALGTAGTAGLLYGQDQVRDHMDNSRAQTNLRQITTKPATELNTAETQRELKTILTQQTDAAIPILGGQTIGEVSNVTRNGNRVQFQAMVDNKPTWFVIGDNGVLVNHTRYNDLVSSGKPREQALREASVFGNGQGNAFLSNPLRQTPKGDFGINYNGYLNLALGPNIVGIDARPLAEQRYSALSTNQALRDELTRNALAQQVTNSNNTLQYVFNGWQAKDGNDPSIVTTRMNPDGSMTIFRRDSAADQAADVQTVKKEDVAQRLAQLAGSMNVVKTQ